jgi:hypothetical protein
LFQSCTITSSPLSYKNNQSTALKSQIKWSVDPITAVFPRAADIRTSQALALSALTPKIASKCTPISTTLTSTTKVGIILLRQVQGNREGRHGGLQAGEEEEKKEILQERPGRGKGKTQRTQINNQEYERLN